ncbi:sigma-70 family RNA polymerase sigma factor [Daejeonella sp.]|jgi:RNA polymerase sigma-70 factor (ECF subfamily)|uniref:RNA polymerase sigma factor n=1 Tax=Daejeonella sp. TaxID=2805397 RepID=UPI0025BAABC4|nr:sigma-70 family RNA polymerase sigma factor [Daejeonella sp.]
MEVNPNFSANARNDFNLVSKAKEGDQKAYAEIMQRYKDSIYFMALKMVNNKDDAMDLTVETFAKAFENLEKYKPEYAFSTWLFRIATNNSIDFIRKKRLNVVSLDILTEEQGEDKYLQVRAEGLNPEETSIRKQESEKLKNMVEQLPLRYRTLIVLRYYEELSYDEIAQQMDIPIGTVKAQLFRARDLMANILNRNKKNLRSDF